MIQEIELSKIDPGSYQQRIEVDDEIADLAKSIAEIGLINPLQVERDGDTGRYRLIAGHRRYAALQRAGFAKAKCEVVERDAHTVAKIAAHENLIRKDLRPIEEANLVKSLIEAYEGDIERVARELKRSLNWVQDRIDFLSYPEELKKAIDTGKLSRGAAKWLARVTDEMERNRLIIYAVQNGCTESLAQAWYRAWEATRQPVRTEEVEPIERGPGTRPVEPYLPCMLCENPVKAVDLVVIRVCENCLKALEQAKAEQARLEAQNPDQSRPPTS